MFVFNIQSEENWRNILNKDNTRKLYMDYKM